MLRAKVEAQLVDEKLGQEEELGNELFDVGGRVRAGKTPRDADRVERAVGHVEVAVLVVEQELGEGRQADQKVEDDARVRVQRTVVERAHVGALRRATVGSVFVVLLQVVVVFDVVLVSRFILPFNRGFGRTWPR